MRRLLVTAALAAASFCTTAASAAHYVQYTFWAWSPWAAYGTLFGQDYYPSEQMFTLTLDATNLTGHVGTADAHANYVLNDNGISVTGSTRYGAVFSSSQFSVSFAPGTFDFNPPYSVGLVRDQFVGSTYNSQLYYYHGGWNSSGYIGALSTAVSDTPFAQAVGYAELPPSPTPEPASWAMLIAGFGLVGGAMRRRVTISPHTNAAAPFSS